MQTQEITFTLPRIKVIQESRKAFDSGYRIIVNQGGTRSGKTFSLIQYMIYLAFRHKYSISVCSVAFPHLRKGAMRDWRKIMEDFKLYEPNAHMKTEQLYTYPTGSYIEFFSVDNQLKVRGPGRDILFINECNIIQYETFRQLLLRTKRAIFIDYNPADEFHWIYDKVLTRSDCYFIKSTYNDNPFLPKEQRHEIESYRDADPNFWRIYGEGERGHSEGVIYTHWTIYDVRTSGTVVFGLDFGYNNPTSLVKITESDKNLYIEEEIYQSHLTNTDLIGMLKQIVKNETIYCDAAEPQRIEEIRRAGFKALPANKDVKAGIDFIKSRKLFIHQGSVNLLKEIKSYKYKTRGSKPGNTPEEPLKLNDHCFTADSMVLTDKGEVPIIQIKEGDQVLTSIGFKTVLKKWHNGMKLTKSYWLHFDTISVHLNCTPDHLISTNHGWIQISQLQSGMMVSLSSSSMAANISSNQGKDILEAISMQCTGTYGNITVAIGREDSIFTTLTTTPGIIESIILNSKPQRTIFQSMVKKGTKKIRRGLKFLMKKVWKPLKRGIKAMKVGIGIGNTRLITNLNNKPMDELNAKFAELFLKSRQAPTDFAIRIVRLNRLEEGPESFEQVFDLTVDEQHEYFVSGVLVHNCMDAMRYAAISFRKHKTGLNFSFHK